MRNRALIVVLYRGGLRLSEALALHPKDVDAKSGTVTVLRGKGDKRPDGWALTPGRWL